MLEINQKTLLEPLTFKGIGLHSGLQSEIKIFPAEANFGIIFIRTDIKKDNQVRALYENVSSAKLCTTLENKSGVKVSTVEHLLAALYITGIDNAIIEINNQEVPIMDGSSKEFVDSINIVGLKTLLAKRKYIKINKKIEFSEDKKKISIEPNTDSLKVDFQLAYDNEVIGNQKNEINFSDQNLEDVYSSRTFCLYEDIEKIKQSGLAKGGSLENAIVVKDNKILNEEGLRNNKEFVNHKILDLAGDFLLSGFRILGHVKCVQGGHSLSNKFIRNVFKDASNFEKVNSDDNKSAKTIFKTSTNKIAVNA